ncbi:type 2 lanthipeptide synthetase LanM family protein [Vitiosangium sp. GDMCC 1.1324]|uniref:type 2 lanthipeptide synthetase LanM family protein n=1 Tax=Vitiosangium sp. (strain GDMCC 1.1324) TaxID=2138576 RepID=UPI000D336848|nr:type 2 lanthipeptide synthetase LanM family protein [Vitiosangium sp. GDMCC 1.1324]PTL81434.1 type 2 lantipeptide synthetase LanM [Vitiosangium sp. GDMCC 1.1324]
MENSEGFARPVATLIEPFLETLAERIGRVSGLGERERAIVLAAADAGLRNNAQLKLNRVLLLELHAAGLTGRLDAADEQRRWAQFIDLARTAPFSEHLRRRYPTLHERLATACRLQLDAVLTLVERFVADRDALTGLPGRPGGELRALSLGAGDSHRGGHTVARLDFEQGTVMYKPRPVQVDSALETVLDLVLAGTPAQERIRIPQVLVRDGYGWAEFVEHRYCEDEAELTRFYLNLGHWLAVMRLVGGTDLHSENLIAHGPVPVVVDVESLFTPDPTVPPSGRGDAVDIAAKTIRGTVLRTGLLPLRTAGLALAGVDISAVGALPGQQPKIPVPTIVDGGKDTARLGMTTADLRPTKNHPSPRPVLERYWDQIVTGFRDLTAHLGKLDAGRGITELLRPFSGCEVRRILRPTQAYAEIGRMLWHPASLHNEPTAITRARDILRRNAEAIPGAPTEPEEIDREIGDLLLGDVPVFTATVDDVLLERTVDTWRSADLPLEEMTIQGALVSAYLNERVLPPRRQTPTQQRRREQLDSRRRTLAARMVKMMGDAAIRGTDGTVTWISPVLTEFGWAIRPLTADVYSGQGGVAVVLAEYLNEVRHRRADAVEGLADTLAGTIAVLRATEDHVPTQQLGAFLGLASQVWTWSTLHDLLGEPWMLERARARAEVLNQRMTEEDRLLEIIGGVSGVIVPMLNLAEQTGEERWLRTAIAASHRLESTAQRDETGARWSTSMFPEAIGGFAHGATGIGWSLARLGLSTTGTGSDRQRWLGLADQAFAFEESLYRPEAGNWADARKGSAVDFVTAWCHGSTGIGLAACDLYVRTGEQRHLDVVRRACAAGFREGFGWSHTLCHGDLGLWELLNTARSLDSGYSGPDRDWMDGELLSSLEERGPVGGLAREAFSPGLMPGLGGVIHLLLRMHPEQQLASPLLMGRCGEPNQRPRALTPR